MELLRASSFLKRTNESRRGDRGRVRHFVVGEQTMNTRVRVGYARRVAATQEKRQSVRRTVDKTLTATSAELKAKTETAVVQNGPLDNPGVDYSPRECGLDWASKRWTFCPV